MRAPALAALDGIADAEDDDDDREADDGAPDDRDLDDLDDDVEDDSAALQPRTDGDDGGNQIAARNPNDDRGDRIATREAGDAEDDGRGEDRGDLAAALGSGDDGALPGEPGVDTLAMLDAELDPGDAIASNDAAYAGGTAGAAEQYEQSLRRRRPSAWGRLDVGVSWRLRRSEPMHAPAHRANELWLVATWRR